MSAPPLYERFRARAAALLDGGGDVSALLQRALERLERVGGTRLADLRTDLRTSVDLIRAWYAGEYRQIEQANVVRLLGAVLYFVVPLDALPDFIVAFGLLDDAAVMAYVVSGLRGELEAFRRWRAIGDLGPPDPADPDPQPDAHAIPGPSAADTGTTP